MPFHDLSRGSPYDAERRRLLLALAVFAGAGLARALVFLFG